MSTSYRDKPVRRALSSRQTPRATGKGNLMIGALKAGQLTLGDLGFAAYDGQRAELRALDWDEGPGILSGAIGVHLETLKTDGHFDLFIDQTGLELLAGSQFKGRAQVRIEPKGKLSELAARIVTSFSGLSIQGIPIRDGQLAGRNARLARRRPHDAGQRDRARLRAAHRAL